MHQILKHWNANMIFILTQLFFKRTAFHLYSHRGCLATSNYTHRASEEIRSVLSMQTKRSI